MSETSHPATKSTLAATSSHIDLLEELKKQLAAPLLTAVTSKLDGYQNRIEYAELKIQLLEERLRQILIKKYGSSSEKLSSAQLELLELEPGVSEDEVQAESERGALPPQSEKPEGQPDRKQGSKHPGRQSLPAHLPRVERVIACTPEQYKCGGCGAETTVIGYEELTPCLDLSIQDS